MKGHCVRAIFLFTQLHVNNSQEAGALLSRSELSSTLQETFIKVVHTYSTPFTVCQGRALSDVFTAKVLYHIA